MEDGGAILPVGMLLVSFVSLIIGSYKNGYLGFSAQSLLGGDRPKFEVDKTKVGLFLVAICSSILVNIVFALIVTHGDFPAALFFSLFNTLALSYALVYWILLKEKDKTLNKD